VDQAKGYLCSMQLGEETAECLFEILTVFHKQVSQIKPKVIKFTFVLHDKGISSIVTVVPTNHPTQMYRVYPWR